MNISIKCKFVYKYQIPQNCKKKTKQKKHFQIKTTKLHKNVNTKKTTKQKELPKLAWKKNERMNISKKKMQIQLL